MNIDLLLTDKGEAGLVCDEPCSDPVVAVLLDLYEHRMFIEMEDHISMPLNINVDREYVEDLRFASMIETGVLFDGNITESLQVPLITLDEDSPYPSLENLPFRTNSVMHFESFIKNSVKGQPIHREDLGNEASLGSLMNATQLIAPQFAPKLEHQRQLEASPRTPAPGHAPQFAGPGGGAGGGGKYSPPSYRRSQLLNQKKHNKREE